jgi:hypothetical protein
LKKAGFKVKRDHYEGLPHMFWILLDIRAGTRFLENVVDEVKFVLEPLKGLFSTTNMSNPQSRKRKSFFIAVSCLASKLSKRL